MRLDVIECLRKSLIKLKSIHIQQTNPESGICYILQEIISNSEFPEYSLTMGGFLIEHCFYSWEHFSGHTAYPVPHPTQLPKDAFKQAAVHETMWEGEYGELRKNLLNHCIKCCEDKIQELKQNHENIPS